MKKGLSTLMLRQYYAAFCFLLICVLSSNTFAQLNSRNSSDNNSNSTDSTALGELIQLRGQITEFSFQSPASSILLLVSGGTGVNTWTIEAPSAAQLRRLGWNSESLFTGELVQVQARLIPGLDYQAELVSVIRANGAFMLASAQRDNGAIDLTSIPSGLYSLDTNHAYMNFSYDHLGYSRPQLRFERFSASLNFNAQTPEMSEVRIEVDVSSLDSGVAALDQELRGEDFFDSLNYPRISFQSNSMDIDAWGHAKVVGVLEIKGQSKDVLLDVQINNASLNTQTNAYTLGVSVSGKINRSDWGMDRMVPAVSDEVQIEVEAEFIQPISVL